MRISVVGATGAIGRECVSEILQRRILGESDTLQLVGRPQSRIRLWGLCGDWYDAFSEHRPLIERFYCDDKSFDYPAYSIEDLAPTSGDRPEKNTIFGDVLIFAAGIATGRRVAIPEEGRILSIRDRRELTKYNAPIFEAYAAHLARTNFDGLVFIVSNPVSLGVRIFANHLGPHRVLGIGIHQDSLRLRSEIAYEINKTRFGAATRSHIAHNGKKVIRRQHIDCSMVGEHGDKMVPLMSQLSVIGPRTVQAQAMAFQAQALDEMERGELFQNRDNGIRQILDLLHSDNILHSDNAIRAFLDMPPHRRAMIKAPVVIGADAKTASATAATTVGIIQTLVDGWAVSVNAEVDLGVLERKLRTEAEDKSRNISAEIIRRIGGSKLEGMKLTVLGVPVRVHLKGWELQDGGLAKINDVEAKLLREATFSVEDFLANHPVAK